MTVNQSLAESPHRVMKFFRRTRKKSVANLRNPDEDALGSSPTPEDRKFLHHASPEAVDAYRRTHQMIDYSAYPVATRNSGRIAARLPSRILERIFFFVCPHSQDETYETCERSAVDDACMLCDQRDLAYCALVNTHWAKCSERVLYHSIRIDSVHYCDREIYLSERRKRRTFFDRNAVPEDTAHARLQLLCRTLREQPTQIGTLVHILKTPYMLRESSQADLARTIAVLPHLRYVDLPEGLFCDDPSYGTLRLEVQARCRNLRKMTYAGGAERSFALLAQGNVWNRLEVLEMVKMNVDPVVVRHALGLLPNLRALKITKTRSFTDDIFSSSDLLPPFPALEEFILIDVPKVTAAGLLDYLTPIITTPPPAPADIVPVAAAAAAFSPLPQSTLRVLTLTKTGVLPSQLREILAVAPALRTLAINARVSSPLPVAEAANPIASDSLETLRYEVAADASAGEFSPAAPSHYHHLVSSILAGSLPRLRAVYVRDSTFAEQLLGLMPPPPFRQHRSSASTGSLRPFVDDGSNFNFNAAAPPNISNNPFLKMKQTPLSHTLEIFSKDDDAMDWSFVKVDPHNPYGRHGPSHGPNHGPSHGPNHGPSHYDHYNRGPSLSSMTNSPAMPFDMAAIGKSLSPPPPPPPLPLSMSMSGRQQRPVSSYGLGQDVAGLGWEQGGARHSVVVGNGVGGFLAVPGPPLPPLRRGSSGDEDEWPRPKSSSGSTKGNMDLWR